MPEKKPAAKRTTASRATTATRRTAAITAAPRARRLTAPRAAKAKAAPAPKAPPTPAAWQKSRRRTLVGNVVSDKTAKTVIVEVARLRRHPLYKKVIRVRRRIPVHDSAEDAKLGDVVRIEQSRPFSATKRFRVVEVVSRAAEAREAAPRVAEVEAALEEAEGVAEVMPRKPATPVAEEETEEEGA